MILQNIFNKLYKVDMAKEEFEKTELATHKIELGLVDDIESEIASANKGAIKGIDMIEAAKKPLENSLKENKNLIKKIERTKKLAIELGATDVLKKIQKFESEVKENIKSIDKILSSIY